MALRYISISLVFLSIGLSSCMTPLANPERNEKEQTSPSNRREIMSLTPEKMEAQVLLSVWKGPYGGLPPFAEIKVADFKTALEAGMADTIAKIIAAMRMEMSSPFKVRRL